MFAPEGSPSAEDVERLCRGKARCEHRLESGRTCGEPLQLTIEHPDGWHPEMVSYDVACISGRAHGEYGSALDARTFDYPTRERWAIFNPDSVNWRWDETA